MSVVSLEVRGMTCESCARHVEQALRAVPGVDAVEASYTEGTAKVSTGDGASSNALISAITRLGYSAKVLDGGMRETKGATRGVRRSVLRAARDLLGSRKGDGEKLHIAVDRKPRLRPHRVPL